MPLALPSAVAATGRTAVKPAATRRIAPRLLTANPLSISIYGDPCHQLEDLAGSIRENGILVPLVVAAGPEQGTWEILSGHRRWACALALGLDEVPCEVRCLRSEGLPPAPDPGV